MQKYDIIGDIHGYGTRLTALLEKLGYRKINGRYQHRESRKVIFLGDLIDRGTENFKTLDIVKNMHDNQQALMVMGNHEFNALCYHTPTRNNTFIRPHIEKNTIQHLATLDEIETRGQEEWRVYLEWFRSLPLFLDLDNLRAIHACWDQKEIEVIKSADIRDASGRLTDDFLEQAHTRGTPLFEAIDILLKGKEILLPDNQPRIMDKDGHLRKKVRLRWWLTTHERRAAHTYADVTHTGPENVEQLAKIPLPPETLRAIHEDKSNRDDKPVFIGHYWLTGRPKLLAPRIACLDYSVARGGHLTAYRWDGESTLDEGKLVKV